MENTKLYRQYKKCKKLEAIETVIGIITDGVKVDDIKKGSPIAVTIEYLMDVHNDIEKSIWIESDER